MAGISPYMDPTQWHLTDLAIVFFASPGTSIPKIGFPCYSFSLPELSSIVKVQKYNTLLGVACAQLLTHSFQQLVNQEMAVAGALNHDYTHHVPGEMSLTLLQKQSYKIVSYFSLQTFKSF